MCTCAHMLNVLFCFFVKAKMKHKIATISSNFEF